jgi:hypothetical protein
LAFIVEDYDGIKSPSQFTFDKAAFWVRMINLPLACMEREIGRKIGSSMGVVELVDTDSRGMGWGASLRVKILLDLSKPLPRGRKINIEGNASWITFQYERLPKFCFQCGVISHGKMGCSQRSNLRQQQQETNQYGPWLRAPSPTRKPEKNHNKMPKQNAPEYDHRGGRGRRSPEKEGTQSRFSDEGEVDRRGGGDPWDSARYHKRSNARRGRSGDHGNVSAKESKKNKEDFGGDKRSYERREKRTGFKERYNELSEEDVERNYGGGKCSYEGRDMRAAGIGREKFELHEEDVERFSHKAKKGVAPSEEPRGLIMGTSKGRKKQKNQAVSGGSNGQFSITPTRDGNSGKYSGPNIADVEKSIQAVQGLTKEAVSSSKLEKCGKRKLRDEEEGLDRTRDSPNKGQIWEVVKNFERGMDGKQGDVLDVSKNGSGMAEAVEQPRRPQ